MPILTLKISPETALRVERMSARRRLSKSALVREALEEKLRQSAESPTLHDAMKSTLGVVDSGVSDLGHNPKHLTGFGR
jgi:predicted transcriptional regulator